MHDETIRVRRQESEGRIELRAAGGPLLGVLLLEPLRLEVRRSGRLFEVDLTETLRAKEAVVLERFVVQKPPAEA